MVENYFDEEEKKKVLDEIKNAVNDIDLSYRGGNKLLVEFESRGLDGHYISQLSKNTKTINKYRILKQKAELLILNLNQLGMGSLLAIGDKNSEVYAPEEFKIYNKNKETRENYIDSLYPELEDLKIAKELLKMGIENCSSNIRFNEICLNAWHFEIEYKKTLDELYDPREQGHL